MEKRGREYERGLEELHCHAGNFLESQEDIQKQLKQVRNTLASSKQQSRAFREQTGRAESLHTENRAENYGYISYIP